jgi:hypothetical protein
VLCWQAVSRQRLWASRAGWGLPTNRPQTWPGADSTPVYQLSQGPGVYLLLAVLVLIALSACEQRDPVRGSLSAGAGLFGVAVVYPFFAPTLALTVGLRALLESRYAGWRVSLARLATLTAFTLPPLIYWTVLPVVDREFGRFAAANRPAPFSPLAVVVDLGLGTTAVLGLPKLLRGNAYQQTLGCFCVALIVALYVPLQPWRSHLYYLTPVLVIGGLAAWWPTLRTLPRAPRWVLSGGLLAATMVSIPYYYGQYVRALTSGGPPAFLSSGDAAAIEWFAMRDGDEVVLAPPDVSPWIAARGHHRVVIGHALWTDQYARRRAEVEAVFDGSADPRPLLRDTGTAWVLVDESRFAPAWAVNVEPVAQFGTTRLLAAESIQHPRAN